MTRKPRPDLPLNARILAALADVPTGNKPHFGKIARQLHVAPAQITVGVLQLVEAGRVDRTTLRPKRPEVAPKPRSYCQHPDNCVAHAVGPCSKCRKPGGSMTAPKPAPPQLARRAATRLAAVEQALAWCGQCDRRVAIAKAIACTSKWCSAELPPNAKECQI